MVLSFSPKTQIHFLGAVSAIPVPIFKSSGIDSILIARRMTKSRPLRHVTGSFCLLAEERRQNALGRDILQKTRPAVSGRNPSAGKDGASEVHQLKS
jgi:hypothetical protein